MFCISQIKAVNWIFDLTVNRKFWTIADWTKKQWLSGLCCKQSCYSMHGSSMVTLEMILYTCTTEGTSNQYSQI